MPGSSPFMTTSSRSCANWSRTSSSTGGEDATDRLLEAAERYRGGGAQKKEADLSWREKPVEERLTHALVHGIGTYVEEDTEEAGKKAVRPLHVIEGPLMAA